MTCTASFIRWKDEPLTRIPAGRACHTPGRPHDKGCACNACQKIAATAAGILRQNIPELARRLNTALGLEAVADPNATLGRLYAAWFNLREEYIKAVKAGQIAHGPAPVKIYATFYSLRCKDCGGLWVQLLERQGDQIIERCAGCRRQNRSASLFTLHERLAEIAPDDDCVLNGGELALAAAEAGFIRRAPGPKAPDYTPPYREPARITRYHQDRNRAAALVAKARKGPS